jgi:nucleoside-diphosphate-sugar epimerase
VSTRVVVTGGAGFVGTLLSRWLLATPVVIGGGPAAPVEELVIADLAAPPPDVAADPRVRVETGDLEATVSQLGEADVIFHLAGVVRGPPRPTSTWGCTATSTGRGPSLSTLGPAGA